MLSNFSFFGTDDFAVKILEELKKSNLLPIAVVTVPDQPQGRHLTLTPPPVKVWAEENKITCLQPEKLKDFTLPACEVAIVASYGKIIPEAVLSQPTRGFVNIHPSLLPKYRGATPLQSAILSNDTETGVTLMEVDAEMDHGNIIAEESLPLTNQTFLELRDQTAEIGAKLILTKLPLWLSGELKSVPQDHNAATFTKKIEKQDGELKDDDSPETNWRKIIAYTPWPGAYFFQDGKRVIIKKANLTNGELVIERVVPEGKNEMDYTTFTQSLE
ncbi:MAG: methionyl-tRNA formyltransferase [Candidatus Pacebacteria bacterium]|nr:methionyl-tRNA formyltransferase [Candidatus Paceibacterota bacterium]